MACPASRVSLALSSRKPCRVMQRERGERPERHERQLRLQEADPGIFARADREQQAPGGRREGKARGRDRDENPNKLLARDVRPPAEQS